MPRGRRLAAAIPAALSLCLLSLLLLWVPAVGQASEATNTLAGGQGVDGIEEPAPSPPESPGAAEVDDLAWLAGRWEGEIGGQPVEEQWSAPAGGAMMGMFRWLREGKPFLYEHFLLEPGQGGPVMHLRHFHPGSIAWEEKERPVPFTLVSLTSGEKGAEAVFEDSSAELPVRLTYRQSRPDGLLVLLDTSRQGRPVRLEFRYRRVEE